MTRPTGAWADPEKRAQRAAAMRAACQGVRQETAADRPRYCPAELGRHMCDLPTGHDVHRSAEGHEWTYAARVPYEAAVTHAARADALWTGAPLIALIYGRDVRQVRADIRKA